MIVFPNTVIIVIIAIAKLYVARMSNLPLGVRPILLLLLLTFYTTENHDTSI